MPETKLNGSRGRRARQSPLLALLLSPALLPALRADVLESERIASGILYARYSEEGLIAHVMKIDLRTRSFQIRSVKARGKETLGQLVDRMTDQDTMVLAGINGDFYRQETSAGIPYGVQVSDGRLIFAPMHRSMIAFGASNDPYIGMVDLKARITFLPKKKRPPLAKWDEVNNINVLEGDASRLSGIYIYTPAFLEFSSQRMDAFIAVVDSIRPALQVGDVCEGTVAKVELSVRPVDVPETGCILYFFGDTARRKARELRPGSPVAIKMDLPPIEKGVVQAIGGGPRLVRGGKVQVEIKKESFDSSMAMYLSERHPRSAIGHDRSRDNLFLVMVEGRYDGSRGMSLQELATFMVKLSCSEAMAFDGGGSAALYAGGKGIVSKSMGGFGQEEKRAIANGLLITASKNLPGKKAEPSGPAPRAAPGGGSGEPGTKKP